MPDGSSFVAVAACHINGFAFTLDKTVTLTVLTEPNDMVNISPVVGEHTYYHGKRVCINTGRSPKCPDVYDFDHWTNDITVLKNRRTL